MRYELRCRECHKSWGNVPKSICEDCFSPLEVFYDYDSIRPDVTRDKIASGPPNIWRYSALLPLPENFEPTLPVGFTPFIKASGLARNIGTKNLYIKNDAVCLPTLSFKDRVVAVALANARGFGFDTVSCSSTGNLANATAAQAARNGFKCWIFIPADLEPAKIVGTQVFGAKLVRVSGSYDKVNRLCSQFADEHHWDLFNVIFLTTDHEIVDSIQVLAESEGIFTETAGGVTVGCARKLYKQDRILPNETTVLCITGNGLKTTDVLTNEYEAEQPIPAKLAEFEKLY